MFVNVNDDTAILFECNGDKVSCVILGQGDNPQDVLVENMLAGISVSVALEMMVGHGFVSMFHVLKMENVDGSRWVGILFMGWLLWRLCMM